jgi:hypothetical protein
MSENARLNVEHACLKTSVERQHQEEQYLQQQPQPQPPPCFFPVSFVMPSPMVYVPTVMVPASREAPKAEEQRTTVTLRNLPNNYTRAMLLSMLDYEGFAGTYDFLYLPIDFVSSGCLGYAFVNLVSASYVPAFWQTFEGYAKWAFPSRKICSVSWSMPFQGLEANVERYKNSPVMHATVPDEYKPLLLKDGVRIEFPAPSKIIHPPRLRRSGKGGGCSSNSHGGDPAGPETWARRAATRGWYPHTR